MNFKYGYFIGGIILGIVWLVLLLLRKNLRKEIVFGSILGLPFGLSEFLFVPEYWNPPSLFDLIHRLGFGIESFMFAFFTSGIASVLYETLFHKGLRKINANYKTHILPYALAISIFLFLEVIFPSKSIYSLIFSFLLAAVIIIIKRPDLLLEIIISGLAFGVLYFLLFLVFNQLLPNFIATTYTLKNFAGIYIMGIPIEEVLFAFSVGTCWSSLYKYIKGYRLINYKNVSKKRLA